ncbi:MAG TPA: efflux RND transporter periplasmic adaptor subunit [Acidobacteriaceae bacterium]|nr:efflux RND transporter periplasmic adaptor subunit [Acidobacteriaceae bacterium]
MATTNLLRSTETGSRAMILAETLVGAVPDSACILYSIPKEPDQTYWIPIAYSGDVTPAEEIIAEKPRIFPADEAPLIYKADKLRREEYAHLHSARTIRSITYLPFTEGAVSGLFELLSHGEEITRQQVLDLQPLIKLAGVALAAAEAEQDLRQERLNSIHRLTQLYDLEKSLNATLELDPLIELIPAKVISMIPAQAIHLWMFDGEDLRLMSSAGQDKTVEAGITQKPGEGYVADMAEEGDPILIEDPEDPRLQTRNQATGDRGAAQVYTALLVPLLQEGSEVGVVEAVNKTGGGPFDDDDLFFLNTMAETISSALKNASLMLSERKLEILEALVHVSTEITSTLRLERLLQIIVNSPQSVLPFERCAIAIDQRGKLQLKAISGMASIPAGDVTVEHLRELIAWLSKNDEILLVRQHNDEPEHEDPAVRAFLKKYFEESGMRAIYALPLSDDQGRVGMLIYESSDPDFLETAHIEMIKVLAGQATVATRNALLYREVPLIQILEPLMHRKRMMLRSERQRRFFALYVVLAAIAFFTLVPLPLRFRGAAAVGAQHIVTIAAPVEGNIASVTAREGERVRQGQVLGAMDTWEWKADLASAQAKYQAAVLALENDLAAGSPKAGQDRAEADLLKAQVRFAELRLANAELRSPINGIVLTPNLQNAAGEHLDAGASFAKVLDVSNVVVNVAVDDADIPLVHPGQWVAIKFDSFPAHTWHGKIAIVSPEAHLQNGERAFFARVYLDNPNAELRAGMVGHAKIWDGFHSAGYVLLRRPALWIWETFWNLIGW